MDSQGITGRIESLNSIRILLFSRTGPKALKRLLFHPLVGLCVLHYIYQLSWRCRYTLEALPVVCVWVVVFWRDNIYWKTNQKRLYVPICSKMKHRQKLTKVSGCVFSIHGRKRYQYAVKCLWHYINSNRSLLCLIEPSCGFFTVLTEHMFALNQSGRHIISV